MKKYLIVFLAAVVSLSGCKEKIDIKLDESSSRVVIEANLTTEQKSHEVKITKSAGYFDDSNVELLSGAHVLLGDGTTTILLNEKSAGIYVTPEDYSGVSGKTYTLKVELDNKTYTAVSVMPSIVTMDSITFEKTTLPINPGVIIDPNKNYYNIRVYSQEPVSEKNYYMVDVSKNGKSITDTISHKTIMDDDIVNGSYLDGYRAIQINAEIGDSIKFMLSGVTFEYFMFVYGVQQSQVNGSPFSGTPANVSTNFSNGAVGFFNTHSVYSITRVIQ